MMRLNEAAAAALFAALPVRGGFFCFGSSARGLSGASRARETSVVRDAQGWAVELFNVRAVRGVCMGLCAH